MKNTLNVKVLYHFYHSAVKAELKRRGFSKDVSGKINEEHKKIIGRAKEIGKSRLLSSYIMATYFIAMNRSTGKPAEENYEILRDGLCASKLFHKAIGDVEHYLDPKKMPGRLRTAISAAMKTTGSLIFCRETGNMTWDTTIMNAVHINCARMRAVRN